MKATHHADQEFKAFTTGLLARRRDFPAGGPRG